MDQASQPASCSCSQLCQLALALASFFVFLIYLLYLLLGERPVLCDTKQGLMGARHGHGATRERDLKRRASPHAYILDCPNSALLYTPALRAFARAFLLGRLVLLSLSRAQFSKVASKRLKGCLRRSHLKVAFEGRRALGSRRGLCHTAQAAASARAALMAARALACAPCILDRASASFAF